jgi:hypothetical protein
MDYDARLDNLIAQIRGVKNKQLQRDLLLLSRTIERALTDLDEERVQCRRLHKETIRYRELHSQIAELLANLEKHLTFASLLD